MTVATQPSDPDLDSLDALLIAALDGDDPLRAALLLRWTYIRLDRDRDADLARIRETGVGPVHRL